MLTRERGSESTAEPRAARPKDKAAIRDLYRPADEETTSMLHGICGRLGHLPADRPYVVGVDFNEALGDLAKLLAADEGAVLLRLGEMQVVEKHLAPMLCVIGRARFEEELVQLLNVLNLLTLAEVEAPRASPALLLDFRRQYKRTFEDQKVLGTLLNLAVGCVAPSGTLAGTDCGLLRRILTLIRNVLAVPDASTQLGGTNIALASTFGRHERLVAALRASRLLEFLMVAASSCNDPRDGRVFGPHVALLVQIFQCIFIGCDPDVTAAMWNASEDGPQVSATEQALQREDRLRRPIRHSRFSGTVVVRLSTGHDYTIPSAKLADRVTLDGGKRLQHQRKKATINDFGENSSMARSSERIMFYEIACEFVRDGVNELVTNMMAQGEVPDGELWNLLMLMSWCLRFVRQLHVKKARDAPAFATVDGAINPEHMTTLGRVLRRATGERQHQILLAGVLYFREAFRLLDLMGHSGETGVVMAARDVLAALFYRHEVISAFRLVLQNSARLSLKMLAVLVEANHVLLKLLKAYCTEKRHVFVAKPRRDGQDEDGAEDDADDDAKEFIFDAFLADYASEAVVNAYLRLLREAQRLDSNTNRFVAAMLVRLASEVRVPILLYRASVLEAVYEVVMAPGPWRKANPELVRVATAIAGAFLDAAKGDPTMIVAAFFNVFGLQGGRPRAKADRGQTMDAEGDDDDTEAVALPDHWSDQERIGWLVNHLVDKEMSAAITWLCSRLFDGAAARHTDGGDVGIDGMFDGDAGSGEMLDGDEEGHHQDFYLHAQTGSLKEAFECAQFRALLKIVGALAPTRENRSWRLPGVLSADGILAKANLVQQALRDAIAQAEDDGEMRTVTTAVTEGLPGQSVPVNKHKSHKRRARESTDEESESPSSENEHGCENDEPGQDYEKDESERGSRRPGPAAPAAAGSKWERMKRSNFFLSAPPESVGQDSLEPARQDNLESVGRDDLEKQRPAPKGKRPALAIYSDSDDA